jgi:hypothetical protein
MALTLVYLLASLICLVFWKRWKGLVNSFPFNQHLERSLVIAYWCLFAGLIYGMAPSLTLWTWDWSKHVPHWIPISLSIAFGLQSACFIYVLTPIVMKKHGQRSGLLKKALTMEMCIALPIFVFVALNLWFYFKRESSLPSF